MKRCILLSLICLAFAVLLPLWHAPTEKAPEEPIPAPTPRESEDARETITLLHDGETTVLTLAEYLPGVVAAEMPASFAPDALRAQAVAARSYTLWQKRSGRGRHPEADVCADPGCCQAWLGSEELSARWGADAERWSAAVRGAVEDTDGVVLTWGGEPILACFHAASAGRTESSAELWGTALPYLVSVPSPESALDVPGYVTTVELSADELRAGVASLAPDAALSGPPEEWVGERVLSAGGRVESLRIGGAALSGDALRRQFSLRSAAFTLAWTGECFLFTVTGSGHGVGLSQYGAEVMARAGSSWREILLHYYPGAVLS